MLNVIYAECLKYAFYAECRYAECHYAECRYAECRYAESRGANSRLTRIVSLFISFVKQQTCIV